MEIASSRRPAAAGLDELPHLWEQFFRLGRALQIEQVDGEVEQRAPPKARRVVRAVGLVDGILERLVAEFPGLKNVVATGGQAEMIASGSRYIQKVDPMLTLVGLKLIYEKNRG